MHKIDQEWTTEHAKAVAAESGTWNRCEEQMRKNIAEFREESSTPKVVSLDREWQQELLSPLFVEAERIAQIRFARAALTVLTEGELKTQIKQLGTAIQRQAVQLWDDVTEYVFIQSLPRLPYETQVWDELAGSHPDIDEYKEALAAKIMTDVKCRIGPIAEAIILARCEGRIEVSLPDKVSRSWFNAFKDCVQDVWGAAGLEVAEAQKLSDTSTTEKADPDPADVECDLDGIAAVTDSAPAQQPTMTPVVMANPDSAGPALSPPTADGLAHTVDAPTQFAYADAKADALGAEQSPPSALPRTQPNVLTSGLNTALINRWMADEGWVNESLAKRLYLSERVVSSMRNNGKYHGRDAVTKLANLMARDADSLYLE